MVAEAFSQHHLYRVPLPWNASQLASVWACGRLLAAPFLRHHWAHPSAAIDFCGLHERLECIRSQRTRCISPRMKTRGCNKLACRIHRCLVKPGIANRRAAVLCNLGNRVQRTMPHHSTFGSCHHPHWLKPIGSARSVVSGPTPSPGSPSSSSSLLAGDRRCKSFLTPRVRTGRPSGWHPRANTHQNIPGSKPKHLQ